MLVYSLIIPVLSGNSDLGVTVLVTLDHDGLAPCDWAYGKAAHGGHKSLTLRAESKGGEGEEGWGPRCMYFKVMT